MDTKYYRFFLLIALICSFGFSAAAQNDGPGTEYRKIIKVRPLQFGEYYASLENVKETDQTNEIGIGFIYKSFVKATEKDKNTLAGFYNIFLNEDEYAVSNVAGIVLRMSQRNFTTKDKEAPQGFYYGPAITYRFIAYDKDLLRDFENEVIGRMYENVLAFHYQVGYQKIVAKHLSLEVFGGVGVRAKLAMAKISKGRTEDRVIAPLKFTPDDNSTVAVAPALHLNISVGYAF